MKKEAKHTSHSSLQLVAVTTMAILAPLSLINYSYAWDGLTFTSSATLSQSTAEAVKKLLADQASPSVSAPHLSRDALSSYYNMPDAQPIWVKETGLNAKATDALAQIAKASDDGLNPEHYGLPLIAKAGEVLKAEPSANARATLELLVSQAVFSYGRDIGYGATPRQNRMRIEGLTHSADAAALLQGVAGARNTGEYLASLAPQSGQYRALKGALTKFRAIAAQGGWPRFTPGKPIKPGMHDSRVATLRSLLVATGDLPASAAATSSTSDATDTLFDETLAAAVTRFQTRHGLEADGVLGTSTQKMLATTVDERIEQITASMERLRWLPVNLGQRYVLVNVPSYTLWGFKDGKEALSMRVIVGASKNPTPLFSNEITDISFNPSWGVPHRIAAREMLPKIQEDPEYLTRAGYRVTHRSGEVIDPSAIDWSQVSAGNFEYTLRQRPGDGNALGKIKFNLPDNDDIYMHDTSSPKLFAKSERALSHGCVRLEKPRDMAHFVLSGEEGWDTARIDQMYDGKDSRMVKVTPMPVYLMYQTAWIDESNGTPYFYSDVYGLDNKLIASLNRSTIPGVQLAQK